MSANAVEVIDLLSSDEEAEDHNTVVLHHSKRERESSPHESRKKRVERQSASVTTTNVERHVTVEEPQEIAFCFSDSSNDNAIITHSLTSLVLDDLPASTISGRRWRRLLQQPTSSSTMDSTLQHIQQLDNWSCGFRNLQMLLTSILPHLPEHHPYLQQFFPSRTTVPSLRELQQALEQSWAAGFDQRGAQHYRHAIVGRPSKIGAVEVSSVLSYWGMDATVIQFVRCPASRSMLGPFVAAYMDRHLGRAACPFCMGPRRDSFQVAQDLLQQQTTTADMCGCPLLPLYLQWEGHSVTVVGVERTSKLVTNLLVYDPMSSGQKLQQAAQSSKNRSTAAVESMRLPTKRLLQKDCQIILCSLRPLTPMETNQRRENVNAITAAEQQVLQCMTTG